LMRKTIVLGAALLLVQIPLLALTLIQATTWGGANHDDANEVAFASDGSVYVAGTTESADSDFDAFLLKYGPDRTLLWARTYGTPDQPGGLDSDSAAGLAVGADNSAYVTGQLGNGVLYLAKFSPAGDLVWDSTYGANGTIPTGAAIDAAGNIYVSGLSSQVNPGNSTEALLIKFDPAGNVTWARAWGGAQIDAARAVAVGTDGIYLAGETNSFFANDAFLVKFDSDGNVVWERDWGVDGIQAPGTGLTVASGIGAAGDGHVYITGNALDTGEPNNIILVKFDANGNLVWQRIGGPGSGGGTDVAVSANNAAVFVSGSITSQDPNFFGGHAFVAEFSPAGKARKANTFGGSLEDTASAESLIIDANGLVVTSGVVGPPPHQFARAMNSAKLPAAHLVIPVGSHNVILSTALNADNGQLFEPDPAVGGANDSFTLWLR
jgi:hypothetical protein